MGEREDVLRSMKKKRETNANVIAKMFRKVDYIAPIGRAVLVFIAFMVAQNGLQSNVQAADILSKYKNGYNVNKFFQLISNDARASSQCSNELTIFGPSDDALKAFEGPINHHIIMNSMV